MANSSINNNGGYPNDKWIIVAFILCVMVLCLGKCSKSNAMTLNNVTYTVVESVDEERVDWSFANDSLFVDAPEEGFAYPCRISGNYLTYINEDKFCDSSYEVLSYYMQPVFGYDVITATLISHYYINIPYEIEYYDDIETFTLEKKKIQIPYFCFR